MSETVIYTDFIDFRRYFVINAIRRLYGYFYQTRAGVGVVCGGVGGRFAFSRFVR